MPTKESSILDLEPRGTRNGGRRPQVTCGGQGGWVEGGRTAFEYLRVIVPGAYMALRERGRTICAAIGLKAAAGCASKPRECVRTLTLRLQRPSKSTRAHCPPSRADTRPCVPDPFARTARPRQSTDRQLALPHQFSSADYSARRLRDSRRAGSSHARTDRAGHDRLDRVTRQYSLAERCAAAHDAERDCPARSVDLGGVASRNPRASCLPPLVGRTVRVRRTHNTCTVQRESTSVRCLPFSRSCPLRAGPLSSPARGLSASHARACLAGR